MEVKSLGTLLFKLATYYLSRGYYYYVVGEIPSDKKPSRTDEKLIAKYLTNQTAAQRHKNKNCGKANVVYLRLGWRFLLIATEGEGEFFESEKPSDFRTTPLHFDGYLISSRNGKAYITVHPQKWGIVKKKILDIQYKKVELIKEELKRESPYNFEGIRNQKDTLIAKVNKARRKAGLKRVEFYQTNTRRNR